VLGGIANTELTDWPCATRQTVVALLGRFIYPLTVWEEILC
jgi:hypothetical protein